MPPKGGNPATTDDHAPPPPPPQSTINKATNGGLVTYYVVRHPWQWVMNKLPAADAMTKVDTPSNLPSIKLMHAKLNDSAATATPTTPATRRRRQSRIRDKTKAASTLRVELCDPKTGAVAYAVHGTSSAFAGLEDKDELVRTIQRCRCDHLDLQPPSILINWDVTREECSNVVGKNLPKLKTNASGGDVFAVLKEPMGSQGRGIFFVKTSDEIHEIVDEHRKRALAEPQFLDNLIAQKNRIPSWVLQAEVVPALLIRGQKKFHIRTYIVLVERPESEDLLDLYLHTRHEVRIAGQSVGDFESDRNPLAHITNGALSNATTRIILDNDPELMARGMKDKVETFVAETFGKHLLPDLVRRVGASFRQADNGGSSSLPRVRQFAIAGLDLMVAADNRIYLLEANTNPAAPPPTMVDSDFLGHLTGFMQDLFDLVTGKSSPNFLLTRDILLQEGLVEA